MKHITIYDLLPLLEKGWVAMEANGRWFWHNRKPILYQGSWHPVRKKACLSELFDITFFDGDWQDSLIKVEYKEENEQLAQKIEELKQQLKDANNVIMFYSNADEMSDEERQMTSEKYHLVYGLKAIDYLEKYGVEK